MKEIKGYWVCPECGYEWSDPKDEWIKSESCELCDKAIRAINKFKLPNHPPWELI
jgi:rubrerythrin